MGRGNNRRRSGVSRRTFVKAAGASGVTAGSLGLAGCLGSAQEDTVIIHADSDFKDYRDPFLEALHEAGLDESITYEVRAAANNTEQRRQDIQSALEAGRAPPDIFMMDSGWTIPFILREQTVNLEEHLSNEVLNRIQDTYLPMSVETASHPETGNLNALPLFPDFPVMLYRRDLVEEAGYDTSGWATQPMSWQEFSRVVADAQEQAGLDFGFTTQASAYEGLSCCTFNETMSGWGGAYFNGLDQIFDAGGREVTVEEEPVLNAIRMMRSFMYGEEDEHALEGFEQISPTSIVQWIEDTSLGPFQNGNAVAHRNWPFAIAETATEDAFGEAIGTMPMPYGVPEEESEYDGLGGSRVALGGWHLAINPGTERLDECVQILEAFTAESVQLTLFEVGSWFPPNIELLESDTVQETEPLGRYTDTLRFVGNRAVPRPVSDVWTEQSAHIYIEVHNAYTRSKSPEQAMADLHERLRDSEQAVAQLEEEDGN
ncbi:substrate-binding domain-containing protein [Halalkalicoccus sp. NIPERK01]|uniref:substrate-binding domain-containing protein n=1 Tax=Halalkalicoccus sp. NIPERK01 TaxID=3053469 RepID=UPI00256F5478|nr:substrate-binding domain-containing protein [Halalkalicoccus sp. NIPERK01]MDL5361399.1 substrate-binding domain-containing protein [Halalkalicoccus sp. NIPERK01]